MRRFIWIMPAALLAFSAAGIANAHAADTGRAQSPQQATSFDPSALATFETTSLDPRASVSDPGLPGPTIGLIRQARAQALRPAPLPNEDFDAPGLDAQTLAAQGQTSVSPSFYSGAKPFAGDGYS
ncbi:MAG: hypothetical protein ACRYFY_10660, partial [Janthinobacterium lividum]